MIRDTDTPGGARERLVFEYDCQGRRIRKQFYDWNGSSYVVTNDLKFIYDGWNLVAQLNGTNSSVIEGYVWGNNLSGSIQGAGGVGGLLKVTDYTGGTMHHFVGYDGNGNVAVLVDGSSGAIAARYEYGPFGEPLRATGIMAKRNGIRFSTKFTDNESGSLYYGYRYYNPSTGRWLSRDPIQELAKGSLYNYVLGDPIRYWDDLGADVHLSPLNGEVFNQSSADITIQGDWAEVDIRAKGGYITKYPWSSVEWWFDIQDPFFIRQREGSASYVLRPGHSSPGDWSPVSAIYEGIGTAIVDADFITGSTKPVYDSIFCLFRQSLPIKIAPFKVTVHDCSCRKGVYVLGPS